MIQAAREEKFKRLSGEILRDNVRTQVLLKKAGFRLRLMSDAASISGVLEL